MQSVGEKLNKARLEKNVSLDEVYKQTKIYPRVLEALEQDRAHNFLSFIYIKGFLKTYARYLRLDGEKLLKEYIDSREVETLAQPEVILEKKGKFFSRIDFFPILRIGLAVFLAFGLFFYFRYVMKNVSTSDKKVQIKKAEPKVKVAPVARVKAKDLILEVKTLDACWMRVKTDNRAVFEKTLAKGRTERWRAREKIELRIGRPKAIEVFLNGKRIDLKKAQVKRSLVITQKGIKGR